MSENLREDFLTHAVDELANGPRFRTIEELQMVTGPRLNADGLRSSQGTLSPVQVFVILRLSGVSARSPTRFRGLRPNLYGPLSLAEAEISLLTGKSFLLWCRTKIGVSDERIHAYGGF